MEAVTSLLEAQARRIFDSNSAPGSSVIIDTNMERDGSNGEAEEPEGREKRGWQEKPAEQEGGKNEKENEDETEKKEERACKISDWGNGTEGEEEPPPKSPTKSMVRDYPFKQMVSRATQTPRSWAKEMEPS